MRVIDKAGKEVKTGDIVWGRESYIFLQCDGHRIEVKTTDDRRMFLWIDPRSLNLTIEANHAQASNTN